VVVDDLDAVDVENDFFVHSEEPLREPGQKQPTVAFALIPLPKRGGQRRNPCMRERTQQASEDQDWQSCGVRRLIFFSAAYLSAAAFTMGLMICSSAWYQSLVKFHFLPSHVWMRPQLAPM